MEYYQVPESLHGKEVICTNGERYPLEEEELLTLKECKKIGLPARQLGLRRVEISRKKIYFFFGKRFAATLN